MITEGERPSMPIAAEALGAQEGTKLDNPGLPETLWSHLDGQLWHATCRDGLHGIIAKKEIMVAFGNRYSRS